MTPAARWTYTACSVCHRPLAHIPGATLLLCPACHHLLNLSGFPPAATAAQTTCATCRHVMLHPLGSRVVVCPLCSTHTPAPLLYYVCPGCSLYLVYSSTLPAVVCAVCHTVDPPVDRAVPRPLALLPLKQDASPRPPPKLPPRRIPWLPSTPVRPVPGPRPAPMPHAAAHPDVNHRQRRASAPAGSIQRRLRQTPASEAEEAIEKHPEEESPPMPLIRRPSGLPLPRAESKAIRERHYDEEAQPQPP